MQWRDTSLRWPPEAHVGRPPRFERFLEFLSTRLKTSHFFRLSLFVCAATYALVFVAVSPFATAGSTCGTDDNKGISPSTRVG